uniref:RanBP2-type domain-containing protein n=1 Tax=Tetradesmus obliquus TaxID=3088 RepID=A0A383VVQ6_TETOB
MRAKNIFKADKGIKCPFCRQYVDGYRSTLTANAAVQRFLLEANKAANIAAAARAAAERKAMGQQGPAPAAAAASSAGSSSSSAAAASGGLRPPSAGASAAAAAAGEDQTWNCGGCGRQNFIWREFCSHCKRPCANPYATDKLSQTKKDLSAVSREELVGYIRDQGGFSLRKGLRDMGVSIDGQKSYGSVQSVREATAIFGLKRVLHIAEMLCDPDALRDASLHYLGNIGVQRVFESLAKLRLAFPPDGPNKDLQEWTATHGGRDPFACLLSALLARSLEFCMHDKGVYVAQCAANLASNAELVEMAKAVFPLALPVSRDPRGVFVLLSLLDLFSQRIWEDSVNCPLALQAVDLLCNQFSCSDKQLVHTCHHALSGKVVVRAIAVSMPRTPALKLAIKIASHAATLAGSGGGLTTLMELMQLYGHNQQAAEGLRDVVTMMCYSLQGQMGRFATVKDEAAQEMLLCLVERLGHEQEVGWLDSIAQELVGCADALQDNPGGMEILKFTLSQPCMDLDNISAHISDMKHLLGKKALLPVVADVMERVGANPLPPAAPKYPAASVIQPELKYYLSQGWRTPLPPPPPPKAGEPGYEEYAAQAAARAEAQAAAAAKARAEKEAAAKARREAAAAAAASGANGGGGSSGAAAADAWSRIRSAGTSSSASAWDVGPIADTSSSSVAGNSVSVSAAAAAAAAAAAGSSAADNAAANPWATVMQGAQAGSSSADAWGGSWGEQQQQQQQQPAANSAPAAAPAAPAAGGFSVPLAVPIAVPIAVPVAAPVAPAPAAAAVPAAVPPRPQFAVPVAMPVAPTPAAAPVQPAPARTSMPVPQQQLLQQQQQQQRGYQHPTAGGIAVADFSSAAPACLQPGITPAVLSTHHWPAPQQAGQIAQQHRQAQRMQQQQAPPPPPQQQQQQRPGSAPRGPAQQHQQQQQQQDGPWSCSVCTYEHAGAEAEFLFCAMCSSQRPA